tara:strand:+ start:509 stop:1243 length:735 start_codon:yes stop_codon:yes gene_type:complete
MFHPLVDKVKTIKENSDYRIGDILYQRGPRSYWKYSLEKVKKLKKYENTILQNYLIKNRSNKLNYKLFLKCINSFNQNSTKKINKPKDNEIVMHLRLGDRVTHENFLKKDFISEIREKINKNNKIDKITIVTCYQYAPFPKDMLHLQGRDSFIYTEEKQNKNKKALSDLIKEIEKNFEIEVKIFSNKDIDMDVFYCVLAHHLIIDNGGFTRLIKDLNQMHKDSKSLIRISLIKRKIKSFIKLFN